MKFHRAILTVASCVALAKAVDPGTEAEVDRRMGILNRPWTIAYNPMDTFAWQQRVLGLTTGNQPYDRQVERAFTEPKELLESLRPQPTPVPRRRRSVVPDLPQPQTPPPQNPNNPNNPNKLQQI